MMGRPRKSVSELKLHGAYRDDRHGDRGEEAVGGNSPVKPGSLSADGEWLWDLVVSEYGDLSPIRAIDGAALEEACRLWGLLCAAHKAAEASPLDKDIRIAVTSYYAAWDRAAAKLGITPRDRRSVSVGKSDKQKSGVRTRSRA